MTTPDDPITAARAELVAIESCWAVVSRLPRQGRRRLSAWLVAHEDVAVDRSRLPSGDAPSSSPTMTAAEVISYDMERHSPASEAVHDALLSIEDKPHFAPVILSALIAGAKGGDAPPQDDDSDRYHSLADAVRAAMHDFEDEYSHGPLVDAWAGMGRTSRTMASEQMAKRTMGHLDPDLRVRVEAAFDGERLPSGDAPPQDTHEAHTEGLAMEPCSYAPLGYSMNWTAANERWNWRHLDSGDVGDPWAHRADAANDAARDMRERLTEHLGAKTDDLAEVMGCDLAEGPHTWGDLLAELRLRLRGGDAQSPTGDGARGEAPVWPEHPPPGWKASQSQNIRKPWTCEQIGDCTHTYETEQGAIDAAWEMATEDARGSWGAQAHTKRPDILAEVAAWSPASGEGLVHELIITTKDRRELLAWGGAQAPDDGRLAGAERDRDSAAEGFARVNGDLDGLRERVETVLRECVSGISFIADRKRKDPGSVAEQEALEWASARLRAALGGGS